MAGTSTAVDDFNDNTTNLTLWAENYGTVAEVGGRARVESSSGFSGYATARTYSLDSLYVRVYPAGVGDAASEALTAVWFQHGTVAGTDVGFYINRFTGKIWFASRTGYFDGAATILDYNPASHAWVRLTQAGGNVVWETSPDAVTWTVRRTLATPAWVAAEAAGRVLLESHRDSGTTLQAEFDNLNTPPTVTATEVATPTGAATWRDYLDLGEYIGQVGCTFRFDVYDGPTGVLRGRLSPLADPVPTLEHDTTSTICRKVTNLVLGADDSEWFRPLSDRVAVVMILGDAERTEFPLGRYMTADDSTVLHSQGNLTPLTLYDEMFIVDQELEEGFNANGKPADVALRALLEFVPVGEGLVMEAPTGDQVWQSWGAGTGRGAAVADLATAGGYFNPWFDHLNRMRFVAVFEPGDRQPDLNLDDPPRVYAGSISFGSDLVTAPNRWIVRSNSTGVTLGEEGEEDAVELPPVWASYDVPSTAPFSIAQRGFTIARTVEAQVRTRMDAAIYARTLGVQRTIYERCTLSTPPDPRHDAYNVIQFNGEKWLEIAWQMPLAAGAAMSHTLRRAYPSSGEDELL